LGLIDMLKSGGFGCSDIEIDIGMPKLVWSGMENGMKRWYRFFLCRKIDGKEPALSMGTTPLYSPAINPQR